MDKIKILLLAEASEEINELMCKIIKSAHYQVVSVVSTYEELKNEIKNSEAEIAILDADFIDHKYLIYLIKELRQTNPSVKSIVMIKQQDEKFLYKTICAGAFDFFIKGNGLNNIDERLNEVMQSRTPIGSLLNNKVKTTFAAAGLNENLYNLTSREKEILNFLLAGFTKRKIADLISLSFHTVDSHLRNIYRKLGVNSRSQAVTKTLREQII